MKPSSVESLESPLFPADGILWHLESPRWSELRKLHKISAEVITVTQPDILARDVRTFVLLWESHNFGGSGCLKSESDFKQSFIIFSRNLYPGSYFSFRQVCLWYPDKEATLLLSVLNICCHENMKETETFLWSEKQFLTSHLLKCTRDMCCFLNFLCMKSAEHFHL